MAENEKEEIVPFEEITKWAASDEYKLKQEAVRAVTDVCVESDIKLKIFLLAAARKKIEVIGRLFKKADYVFEQTFTDANIQAMTIPQKMQAYQLLQNNISDYLGSLAGSEEAMQEVTKILKQINVQNFTVNVGKEDAEVLRLREMLDKLPVQSRERIRKVLMLLPNKENDGSSTSAAGGSETVAAVNGSGEKLGAAAPDGSASVPNAGAQVSPPPRL